MFARSSNPSTVNADTRRRRPLIRRQRAGHSNQHKREHIDDSTPVIRPSGIVIWLKDIKELEVAEIFATNEMEEG